MLDIVIPTEPPDLTIVLPLPHKSLSPNARVDRRERARKISKAREDGYLAAKIALQQADLTSPLWTSATVRCRFYFKTKRGRDSDNASSSMKAAMDGLSDAGIWINDKVVTPLPPLLEIDKQDPRVEIDVWGGLGIS